MTTPAWPSMYQMESYSERLMMVQNRSRWNGEPALHRDTDYLARYAFFEAWYLHYIEPAWVVAFAAGWDARVGKVGFYQDPYPEPREVSVRAHHRYSKTGKSHYVGRRHVQIEGAAACRAAWQIGWAWADAYLAVRGDNGECLTIRPIREHLAVREEEEVMVAFGGVSTVPPALRHFPMPKGGLIVSSDAETITCDKCHDTMPVTRFPTRKAGGAVVRGSVCRACIKAGRNTRLA